MKSTVEIQVSEDGSLQMPYEDGADEVAQALGGTISHVERASNIEWEVVRNNLNARFPAIMKGWTVRSAHDHKLALRIRSHMNAGIGERYFDQVECSDLEILVVAVFDTRDEALEAERKFFWKLIKEK